MAIVNRNTQIDYDEMVQDALRGVVRETLTMVEEGGLLGSHHYYIAFASEYPGVDVPDYLKDQYPDEITIVLQYEFWDLEVLEDYFSVTLCFNDIHERLTVPFSAIVSFVDPSVKFGLQFEPKIYAQEPIKMPSKKSAASSKKRPLKKPSSPFSLPEEDLYEGPDLDFDSEVEENEEGSSGESSNVVTLDAFRKK